MPLDSRTGIFRPTSRSKVRRAVRPVWRRAIYETTTLRRWLKTRVKIRVPKEGARHASEEDAPQHEVKGVYIRDLLAVVEGMYGRRAATEFH